MATIATKSTAMYMNDNRARSNLQDVLKQQQVIGQKCLPVIKTNIFDMTYGIIFGGKIETLGLQESPGFNKFCNHTQCDDLLKTRYQNGQRFVRMHVVNKA